MSQKNSPERDPESEHDDLDHVEDVFARTLRFLERCAVDPQAAIASQNPRELIRELEALRDAPRAKEEAEQEPQTRSIPLRRRKSA